jgi:hypothetical protein
MKRSALAIAGFMTVACSNSETSPVAVSKEAKHQDENSSASLSIANGFADGAGNDSKVFFLTHQGQTEGGFTATATAFSVIRPRCLLTSGHVLNIN